MNLETRLEQLNYAIKMELWQEAYKAIEDISDLMNKSKKMPKPHVMASYYQKLSLVFWKAGNMLFHAAALFKLFQLLRDQKKNITGSYSLSKNMLVYLTLWITVAMGLRRHMKILLFFYGFLMLVIVLFIAFTSFYSMLGPSSEYLMLP